MKACVWSNTNFKDRICVDLKPVFALGKIILNFKGMYLYTTSLYCQWKIPEAKQDDNTNFTNVNIGIVHMYTCNIEVYNLNSTCTLYIYFGTVYLNCCNGPIFNLN